MTTWRQELDDVQKVKNKRDHAVDIADAEDKMDSWEDDTDILNNHEKLMSLQWTEKDLELATSRNFLEQQDIVRELILQDSRILMETMKIEIDTKVEATLKRSRSQPSSFAMNKTNEIKEIQQEVELNSEDSALALASLDNLIQLIHDHQRKCLEKITNVKSKKWWCKMEKDALLSEENLGKVKRWIEIIELFGKTFERAQTLRVSRKSMMPSSETDPKMTKLVEQLRDIYAELSCISKVFDNLDC